jgi:energy-coupling factor transporter ATP-binding protein EcfA2
MATATMPAPLRIDDLGIRRSLLEDIALKTLYLSGELSLGELAEQMHVNLNIADELFQFLRKQQMVEVTGMTGSIHRITTTSPGKNRALELLNISQYVGPAPVSLSQYVACVRAQTVRVSHFRPADLEAAFHHLVLDPPILSRLGAALASGRAIFLHGPTGTGKTSIAETLSLLMARESVWIPYAVEMDGQIITVFDPNLHRVAQDVPPNEHDQRWVFCKRPRVVVGGELTVEMLDLQFNPSTRFYTAPIQMKANNGLLIVDDFGRQRVHPHELLNRWVVPLDRHLDFLTMAGGKKMEIPFDLFVVFATNLDVAKLVDDAFLRRIQTKIKIDFATPEQFHKIFQNVCAELKVPYDGQVVEHAINLITGRLHQSLRPCYPRDLMQQIVWMAKYLSTPPVLDDASLMQACESYFVEPEESGHFAISPSGH